MLLFSVSVSSQYGGKAVSVLASQGRGPGFDSWTVRDCVEFACISLSLDGFPGVSVLPMNQ